MRSLSTTLKKCCRKLAPPGLVRTPRRCNSPANSTAVPCILFAPSIPSATQLCSRFVDTTDLNSAGAAVAAVVGYVHTPCVVTRPLRIVAFLFGHTHTPPLARATLYNKGPTRPSLAPSEPARLPLHPHLPPPLPPPTTYLYPPQRLLLARACRR